MYGFQRVITPSPYNMLQIAGYCRQTQVSYLIYNKLGHPIFNNKTRVALRIVDIWGIKKSNVVVLQGPLLQVNIIFYKCPGIVRKHKYHTKTSENATLVEGSDASFS